MDTVRERIRGDGDRGGGGGGDESYGAIAGEGATPTKSAGDDDGGGIGETT